jgi:hypothetical protein
VRELGVAWWLVLAACRANVVGYSPVADDIDAIEAALAERDTALANEGIVVAYRDRRPPPPTAGTVPGGDAAPMTDPPLDEAPEPMPGSGTPGGEPEDAADPDLGRDPPSAAPAEPTRESVDVERTTRRANKAAARDRCENRCALVDPTCGLRDRICDLAERHADDARYLRACDRAEDQCETVTRGCSTCAV